MKIKMFFGSPEKCVKCSYNSFALSPRIIWAWQPSWLCELDNLYIYILIPPFHRCFTYNLALIRQAVSEEKMFEYYGNIHVYWGGGR